jgi:hypothetical protein
VIHDLSIGFKRPQTGEVNVELVNSMGQLIYAKAYNFTGQSKLDVHINKNTQPGIYYLRIRNIKTNEQLMQKLIVR